MLRHIRRHLHVWREVYRRNEQEHRRSLEWTQHPLHRRLRPIQTSSRKPNPFFYLENSYPSTKKTFTPKNFRELFYRQVQTKNQRPGNTKTIVFIQKRNNVNFSLELLFCFTFYCPISFLAVFSVLEFLTFFSIYTRENKIFLTVFKIVPWQCSRNKNERPWAYTLVYLSSLNHYIT